MASKKRRIKPLFVLLVGILCFALGIGGGYVLFHKETEKSSLNNRTLLQLYNAMNNQFYDTTNENTSLLERLSKGLVLGAGDPHTSYMTKSEFDSFQDTVDGDYDGIGIDYLTTKEGAIVTTVYPDTPALKGKVQPGDLIIEVAGISMNNKSSSEIGKAIRGEKGTAVSLTVLRGGKRMVLHVERSSLDSSLNYGIKDINGHRCGYVDINTFGTATSSLFEKALASFKKNNVKSLIIDLRDNGGGYVDAAEECLALLNKKDTVLYMTKTKNGKVTKVKDATDDHYQFEQGLILVNNMSASASEIMASSLKKNNNYTIVGEKTYGKGTVQVEMPLANGGVLKYTYAKWLTPDGTSINKVGIVPNVVISDAPLARLQLEKVPATYHFDQLNDYIKTMEIMLDALGYKPGRTDGYFSKDAQNALKAFQKKEHLKESGNYDQESYYHLLSAYVYAVGTKSYDPIYSKALSMLK